jgi:hypothetical protein
MSDDERVRKLHDHLVQMAHIGHGMSDPVAAAIIANPKAHMDALMEAGVVKPMNAATGGDWESWYRLPKPHVHEPQMYNIHSDGQITRKCVTCGEWLAAVQVNMPAKIPIEWPDDE